MEPTTTSNAQQRAAEETMTHAHVHPAMDPEHARGLLLVGLFKLCKCLVALGSGAAAYHLARTDPGELAMRLVDILPIDPVGRLATAIMNQADAITPHGLRQLGLASFALAVLYLIEGTGLLLKRVWAEYLTVVMTAAAMPWEIYEIVDRYTYVRLAVLLGNAAVVLYLALVLAAKKRKERSRVRTKP